jgi:hypothetical protein
LQNVELLAKVRNLPFDRLRVNGLRLKLFSFSVCGELVEPQKNTFARASVDCRFQNADCRFRMQKLI